MPVRSVLVMRRRIVAPSARQVSQRLERQSIRECTTRFSSINALFAVVLNAVRSLHDTSPYILRFYVIDTSRATGDCVGQQTPRKCRRASRHFDLVQSIGCDTAWGSGSTRRLPLSLKVTLADVSCR